MSASYNSSYILERDGTEEGDEAEPGYLCNATLQISFICLEMLDIANKRALQTCDLNNPLF